MWKAALLPLLLLTALLPLSSCVNDPAPDEPWSVGVGEPMPRFEVTLLDGTVVTQADVELVCLFNTSCADCRAELPVLQQLHERHPELRMVCIARAQGTASVAAYWAEQGLTLPVSPQLTADVYHLFASSVIPRIYIASGGIITATFADNPLPSLDILEKSLSLR